MKKTLFIFIILVLTASLWRNAHAQGDTVVSASGDISVGAAAHVDDC